MHCYVCDGNDRTVPAVAICQNCGVALCREHLDEDLLVPRAQGLVRQGCTHTPVHSAQAIQGPRPADGSRKRVDTDVKRVATWPALRVRPQDA